MNFPLCMIIIFVIGGLFGFAVHAIFSSGYDGTITVTKLENDTLWTLKYNDDPNEIDEKKSVRFKVL